MLHTQLSPTEHLAENTELLNRKKVQLNREKAQLNTSMGVVNCYLREYAIPNKQVDWCFSAVSLPQTLKRNYTAQQRVAIHLPHQNLPQENGLLVLPIEYMSKLGKIKLSDRPWAKMPGVGWCKLDATQTLTLLLNYLKQVLEIPFNHELVEQMENSLLRIS